MGKPLPRPLSLSMGKKVDWEWDKPTCLILFSLKSAYQKLMGPSELCYLPCTNNLTFLRFRNISIIQLLWITVYKEPDTKQSTQWVVPIITKLSPLKSTSTELPSTHFQVNILNRGQIQDRGPFLCPWLVYRTPRLRGLGEDLQLSEAPTWFCPDHAWLALSLLYLWATVFTSSQHFTRYSRKIYKEQR